MLKILNDNELGLHIGEYNNGCIYLFKFKSSDITSNEKDIINSTYKNILQLNTTLRQSAIGDCNKDNICKQIDENSQILSSYLSKAIDNYEVAGIFNPFEEANECVFIL